MDNYFATLLTLACLKFIDLVFNETNEKGAIWSSTGKNCTEIIHKIAKNEMVPYNYDNY